MFYILAEDKIFKKSIFFRLVKLVKKD